eukprot:TRINITY_DN5493_c0_g1_i2.p1 TRINITY_DN5493_c0_g1~~TRINITY_DN5493_c0_g1_i2.p1  ORF type:complete len:734 (-),score=112.08 TRINITY_DN5493_c0_g1_i2:30-2231(-)
MIRRPPRSTQSRSSAASDVYKRQGCTQCELGYKSVNGTCEVSNNTASLCSEGEYFDRVSVSCKKCDASCRTCEERGSKCTSCRNGAYLYGGVCVECNGSGLYFVEGICSARCGDGIVAGNETCDDNNTLSGDGCSSLCLVEEKYACAELSANISICTNKTELSFSLSTNPFDSKRVSLLFSSDVLIEAELPQILYVTIPRLNLSQFNWTGERVDGRSFYLNFEYGTSISQGQKDVLYAEFMTFFVSQDQNGKVLSDIRVTVPLESFYYENPATLQQQKVASQVFMASSGATSVSGLLASNSRAFWRMIDVCQFIDQLRYLSIVFPQNVNLFLDNFAAFNADAATGFGLSVLKKFNLTKSKAYRNTTNIPPKVFKLNQTTLFIANTYVFLLALLLISLCHGFLLMLRRLKQFQSTRIDSLLEGLTFGAYLRAILLSFVKFVKSMFLQCLDLDWTTSFLVVNNLLTFVSLAATVAFLAFVCQRASLQSKLSNETTFLQRFAPLWEDLNLGVPYSAFYIFISLLQKVLVNVALIYCGSSGNIQVALLFVSTIVMLTFLIKVRPFTRNAVLYQRVASDSIVCIAQLILFVITNSTEGSKKVIAGNAFIVTVSFLIAVNLGAVFVDVFYSIKLFIKARKAATAVVPMDKVTFTDLPSSSIFNSPVSTTPLESSKPSRVRRSFFRPNPATSITTGRNDINSEVQRIESSTNIEPTDCALIVSPNAVSYTHLTLPTIYSV